MLIEAHPVSPWQSNCYLVAADGPAAGDTTPCIIIDPGIMSFDVITDALEKLKWQPGAVLLTHGHLDHVGDAHRVAACWGVPVHCAQEDLPILARPSLGLGESSVSLIEQFLGADSLPLPAQIRPFDEAFAAAGLMVTPFAAPGHTAGSTLLEVSDGHRRSSSPGTSCSPARSGEPIYPAVTWTRCSRHCRGSRCPSPGTSRCSRATVRTPH